MQITGNKSDDDSFDEDLQEIFDGAKWKKKNQDKRKGKKQSQIVNKGEALANCRLCLKEPCQLKYLTTHVKNIHPNFFVQGASRNSYLAKPD